MFGRFFRDFTPGRPLRAYNSMGDFKDFSTDEFVGKKLNQFHSWACGLGVQNIHIDMDGIVYGASCKVGGKLGNVFDDFKVPTEWLTCTRKVCSCGADLFIPKVKEQSFKLSLRKTNGLRAKGKHLSELQRSFELAAIERTHNSKLKQVYWEIGRRCNYDCSYCWPWIHNNHEGHKTLHELMKATKLVEDRFCKGDKVNFIISGGEPTINPGFLEWIKYLHSQGHKLSMHSNGSRLPAYYREIIHYGDLNLSVHFEFYKRDKFLRVVSEVTDEKIRAKKNQIGHLEVKIMLSPGQVEEALVLEQGLKLIKGFKKHCTWSVVPIRDIDTGENLVENYETSETKMFGDRS